MLQNIVYFKAQSFLSERNTSTMAYEVKAVRALWDPSLSIPGTNRRGGWRCPVGTRYGGQITDRFGRSCGWGVARRIANQISDIGSRLENVDDARRGRRIARRERRIIARLNPQDARAGRLERGLRGVAERLEGEEAPTPRGARRREVTARTSSVDTPEVPRELTPAPRAPRRRRAPARRQPDGGNLRESEERRMEREIEQPGAPRTGEAPARRRRRAVVETVSKPKAPVKKPEAVVEPKVVKPRRPQPGNSDNAARSEELRQARSQAARQAAEVLANADRERAFAMDYPEEFANAFMPSIWNQIPPADRQEFRDQYRDEQGAIDDVLQDLEQRILDEEFGDPLELRERIGMNNDEIRNANKRLERDLQILKDLEKPAPLERQRVIEQNRRDALSRIAVNARDRRRRELENDKFQEAIDIANANGSTPKSKKPKTASRGAGRKVDLNQILNERFFGQYIREDVIPNDRIMIINDPANFPNGSAARKTKRAEAIQKINRADSGLNKIEQAIARGELSDNDFIERNGEKINVARVKTYLRDYKDAWREVFDGNVFYTSAPEAPAPKAPAVPNAPAAPAVDPIDAPFITPDKKDIRNVPEALKHQPPKMEPAKFKAEQEQIIEEAMLEIRDVASLNKFSLLVDQAIFNENEGRQGALRNFQKELTKVAEILKRNPDADINALIAERKREYLANFQMRGGVANARTKLNELETQLQDKFIKLRTPPGNGAEDKERNRVKLMEDIATLKKSIGTYEGHLQLVDALEPEIRKASDRIKQGFVFDPDATNIPKPTPADVKKKIKDQISAAIERRQGKLAKYLEERYPNGGGQFQDMTPEKWRTLSPIQRN